MAEDRNQRVADATAGGGGPAASPAEHSATTCRHREVADDFFCLRFGVWYASIDCAYRTRYRTSQGCLGCDQGRFNLKRHAARLR